MPKPTMLGLVAEAVIKLAFRQCNAKDCGIMDAEAGTIRHLVRCSECPLDDVDRLHDEMQKESG
jgi:hypothetical protein